MSRRLLALLLIFLSVNVSAQSLEPNDRTRQLLDKAKLLTGVDADGCLINQSPDEIVVCARTDPNREYRLPLPRLSSAGDRGPRREIPAASAARVRQGSCGTVGQNFSGCTGGLDVLSIVGLLGSKILGLEDDLPDSKQHTVE